MGFSLKKTSVKLLIISLVFIGILQVVHSQNTIYKSLNSEVFYEIGEVITIDENMMPIANVAGTWSVCNLAVTIGIILMTALVGLARTKYHDKTNIDNTYIRRRLPKYQSLVIMIIVILLMAFTESFRGYSVMVNKWTIMYIFIAFIHIYVCVNGMEKLRPRHKPDEN